MKRTSKRMLASLLAAITMLSATATVGAFAAETVEEPVAAVETAAVSDNPEVEVGKVTGLKKTTTEINNINLVWNQTNGADGYIVYRCSADYDNGRYKKVADVTTNTYNDTKLVQGCPYWYKVVAYKTVNGSKVEGEATLYKTATQPAKVTGLSRVRSSDTIEIAWNRNVKATGYKVFRSSADTNNQYELIRTIESGTVTSFADTNVKGGTIYNYKVVAFRVLYNTCWYHSPGSTIYCMGGLCAPNFSFSSQLYRVNLSWKRNAYATRYDIYYSADKNATKYTLAGTTTGTSFKTGRLPGGKQLYFRVYPIYKTSNATVTGTAHTKLVTVSNKMYGETVPSTYVEVDINQQRMWLIRDGKVIVDTPVVTGTKGVNDTPKGYHHIYQRATNTVLYGDDYASPVDYWMAFCGGCGLHDASWRSSFPSTDYLYHGSHGCVNTPYNAVRTIYNNTTLGTPVIIY